MWRYAVCRTADLPSTLISHFLSTAYAGSEELAPGSSPSLVLLSTPDDDLATAPIASPTSEYPASSFIGQSPKQILEQLGPDVTYFVILDAQSARDESALLVARDAYGDGGDGEMQTVRVGFESAEILLVTLEVGSIGFNELQSIAAGSGGVYRRENETPQRGGYAPRKRLGS